MRLTCLLQVFIAAAFFAATTAAWAGPQEDYRKGLNARAANDVVGAMASFTPHWTRIQAMRTRPLSVDGCFC
jgi:hypothetical protein